MEQTIFNLLQYPEKGSPIHKLTLVAMGMPLLDNLNLEDIAKESIRQNSWEFLLCMQPLRFKKEQVLPWMQSQYFKIWISKLLRYNVSEVFFNII